MDGWIDGWMIGWMDGRTDGQTDRQTDGWTHGWMHGWTDGCMDAYSIVHIIHICTCRFRITWSGDKDKFIVRFKDTNPGVAEFDATFSR